MHPSTVSVFITLCAVGTAFAVTPVHATEDIPPCQNPPSASPTSSTAHVELSELYPSPAEGEEEFIELYNASNASVDLAGWSITDASGKKFTLPSDAGSMSANGYRALPFSQTKIYLNNTSDTVTLLRPDASTADTTTYDDTTRGESWARIANTWQWTTAVTADTVNEASAPEAPAPSTSDQTNSPSTPATPSPAMPIETSDAIMLNELLPNPAGSETTDEWIELYNAGDTAVNLNQWQLTDQTRYFTITDTRIPAHGYVVFESSETRINLNNTGDTVYLVDPNGTIRNGTTYEAAAENQSWADSNNSWAWTTSPTPGAENTVEIEEDDEAEQENPGDEVAELSIAEAQQQPDGTIMSVTGVVSVMPGVFSTQYFYIQDSSGGIQVYSYTKQFPELDVGDLVVVNGEKSSNRGESRVKTQSTEDIAILKHSTAVAVSDVAALEEATPGTLVRITGTVTHATSTSVTLDDVTPVTIKSTSGVTKTQFPVGETVSVTGLALVNSDGATLVPRSPADIELVATESSLIPAAHAAEPSGTRAPSEVPTNTTITSTTTQSSTKGIVVIILAAAAVVTAGVVLQLKKKREVSAATPHTHVADATPPRAAAASRATGAVRPVDASGSSHRRP